MMIKVILNIFGVHGKRQVPVLIDHKIKRYMPYMDGDNIVKLPEWYLYVIFPGRSATYIPLEMIERNAIVKLNTRKIKTY